jgi:hypothetical protein
MNNNFNSDIKVDFVVFIYYFLYPISILFEIQEMYFNNSYESASELVFAMISLLYLSVITIQWLLLPVGIKFTL